MLKLEWKIFWRIYRKSGFSAVRYYGRDFALICSEVAIARDTPDALPLKRINRINALRHTRAMGKIF